MQPIDLVVLHAVERISYPNTSVVVDALTDSLTNAPPVEIGVASGSLHCKPTHRPRDNDANN